LSAIFLSNFCQIDAYFIRNIWQRCHNNEKKEYSGIVAIKGEKKLTFSNRHYNKINRPCQHFVKDCYLNFKSGQFKSEKWTAKIHKKRGYHGTTPQEI